MCNLCGRNPVGDEDFCYGCQAFICGTCADINLGLMGSHDIDDHLSETDDEGWAYEEEFEHD